MSYTVYQGERALATVSAPRAIDAIDEVMTRRLGPEWKERAGAGIYLIKVKQVLAMEESRSKPTGVAPDEPMPLVSVSGHQWYR